jgi:hypothetical protein
MLMKPHVNAELAETDAFLGGRTESDGFVSSALRTWRLVTIKRHLGRSPRDSATVYHQDMADAREACGWDIIQRSVGVTEDGVLVGMVESAPFEGAFIAKLKIAQDLLGGGHVGLACCGHVSCGEPGRIESS